MTEQIFKQDAKNITDSLFETKIFKDNITRDDMNAFEDYISFTLQSKYNVYRKCEELCKQIESKKTT